MPLNITQSIAVLFRGHNS